MMYHRGEANTATFMFGRSLSAEPDLMARKLLRNKIDAAKVWHRKDLYSHYGCVNAIEFSTDGKLLVSGGDDRRVLAWKVDDIIDDRPVPVNPMAMRAEHGSNIFCLTLNSDNSKIFSAGNDETVIIHDLNTGSPLRYYLHDKPVYCISLEPGNDNVFCSASDDGRVLIYDIRREPSDNDPLVLATSTGAYHGVMFNPMEPRLVATANAKQGLCLYDVRKPKEHLICYGESQNESYMSVRFNQKGSYLLGLRRRREALMYPTHSSKAVVEFDNPGYYNSCTMKSCCFAGPNDEYVLSGSDDFNLYMWKVPQLENQEGISVKKAHYVLSGHRSIVNQVRYNSAYNMVASSGVEKIIKLWSPMRFPGNCDDPLLQIKKKPRKMYTHEEYITLVLQSGQFMSHDYSQQNTEEDPRMMAFFDSLVQREVEGWSTDEDGEKLSSDIESTASSSEDYDVYLMGYRRRIRRRQMSAILRGNGNGEFDETNNRIALMIARKRKMLMRSRNHQAKRQTTSTQTTPVSPPPVQTSSNRTVNPDSVAGPSTSSGSTVNGKRRCFCQSKKAKTKRRNRVVESSDEEELPKRVKKVSKEGSDSESDSSSESDDAVCPSRGKLQQDSGVELNGSSSSSHANSSDIKFKKSERKPNKREYRRRTNSSSEDSSDSD
ncbi:DDB1- and CUL4-associated factor 5 [Neocloeon triangulifer]|uniref:DDB1- and CUL4-associated factor 5 n=1 Tax=Neocloeon triangulifer TaxID=2078957 RepID=UPI00286ED249|nr:DDB1- and CUL4-associated factor 5 [Neocloeon triangulifer]